MSALMTEPHRPRLPVTPGVVDAVRLALALLVMVALTAPALRGPARVDQLTVGNPHGWDVTVDLVDLDGRPRLRLGPVNAASNQTFTEVLDQGTEWVFRFSSGGRSAQVHRAGRQLAGEQWQVIVPDSLAADLRAAGAPPSAP